MQQILLSPYESVKKGFFFFNRKKKKEENNKIKADNWDVRLFRIQQDKKGPNLVTELETIQHKTYLQKALASASNNSYMNVCEN